MWVIGVIMIVLGLPLLIAQALKGSAPNQMQLRLGGIFVVLGLLLVLFGR